MARNDYTKAEQRRIAIGAVRSEMRRYGEDPKAQTAERALIVLDDIARQHQGIAAQWYMSASSNQIRLFKKEWEMGNVFFN